MDYLTGDPYPWVTIDENGDEFRTHTAHEDGVDENGNVWEGWTYAPRPEYTVTSPDSDGDPYPWVTTDENGDEFRTHTAHEDGVDENGNVWEGWTFAPRSEYTNA